MNKSWLIVALLGCSLWSAGATAAEQLDQTIALVEEDVILQSELQRRMQTFINNAKKNNQEVPPQAILQERMVDSLVIHSLQLQLAKRAGVRISDQELNATLTEIARGDNKTLAELREKIIGEGTSWELFREDLREEIMITRIRNGQVSRRISISEREVENLVALIDAEGEQRTQYHLGHILIPINDSSDQQAIQKARELASDIVSRLRKGGDFRQLAIQYSKGQEALNGGDFGWRPSAQLPSLFAAPAKNLEVGGISEPLRSGSGFHILKLLEKKGEVKRVVQQVNARHILISPSAILTDAQAKERALELRQRVINGEDFGELAKEFSEDKGSALQGGELGWAVSDKYVGPFKEAVNTLEPNILSAPVTTQFGYHIIEVLGRRDADQTAEFKREQAARILQRRKFDEEVESWIQELRDTSYVEMLVELGE